MKILVIGAGGLLARPVIRHMDKAGFQLRLFSRSVNESMFDKEFEMVQGDVFNLNDLKKSKSWVTQTKQTSCLVNQLLHSKTGYNPKPVRRFMNTSR